MVRVNVLLCVMLGVLVASASAVSRPAGIPLLVGLKQQNLDKLREFVDAVRHVMPNYVDAIESPPRFTGF